MANLEPKIIYTIRCVLLVILFIVAFIVIFLAFMALMMVIYLVMMNYLGKDSYSDQAVMRNGRIMNVMRRIPYSSLLL